MSLELSSYPISPITLHISADVLDFNKVRSKLPEKQICSHLDIFSSRKVTASGLSVMNLRLRAPYGQATLSGRLSERPFQLQSYFTVSFSRLQAEFLPLVTHVIAFTHGMASTSPLFKCHLLRKTRRYRLR